MTKNLLKLQCYVFIATFSCLNSIYSCFKVTNRRYSKDEIEKEDRESDETLKNRLNEQLQVGRKAFQFFLIFADQIIFLYEA